MISDLKDNINNQISYSVYADDIAIWTSGDSPLDCHNSIQPALNSLCSWGLKWGLSFSASKSKSLFFTRKRLPANPLTIGEESIENVTSFKFLGITFDRSLCWKPHIEHLKIKCDKDLNMLRVISGKSWGADFNTIRKFYIAFTLSKINFCSFIFHNAAKSNLKILDRIQFAAARIMLGALRCTRVDSLEMMANLLPLHMSRDQQLAL